MGLLLLFSISFASASINKTEIKMCKDDCKAIYKASLNTCKEDYTTCKENCTDSTCKRTCSQEKNACMKSSNVLYRTCQKNCTPPKIVGCLNGTINEGDTFAQGCDICKCGKNGQVSCKREAFCNKNTTTTKQSCETTGGFYQGLCNGPHFDIVCSQQKFCLCEGSFDYTCGENHSCLKEFISPNKRTNTVEGWKTMLGVDLGDIGVCVKD